jgi:arylformamidase
MTKPNRTPDAQLNLRERHPDYQIFLDRNERESDRVRSQLSCTIDARYGDAPLQTFDIFPSERPNSPIFVFIHGGYWRGLDKASYSFTAERFVRNGCTACVINYRLLPVVKMQALVEDVQVSLATIRERAREYNGDPDHLILCGHSAGGHLAILAPLMNAAIRNSVQGICSISGLFDLEPIRNSSLNETLQLDAATARKFSPRHLDLSVIVCPVLLSVGASESEVFIQQSRDLFGVSQGLENFEYLECPGLNHYQMVHTLLEQEHRIPEFILKTAGNRSDS